MNTAGLIDALVRQTCVLIAQLATTGGGRTQLVRTAQQVFLDLVEALREQGLGNRVIADMFGLALRTFQERVRRMSESQTVGGKSLWEAVLEFVQQRGPCLRSEVLQRFRNDDPDNVRGVLLDLVNSGLVYRTGTGGSMQYTAVDAPGLAHRVGVSPEALLSLVWITVQQRGPVGVSDLVTTTALDENAVILAVSALADRGVLIAQPGDPVKYTSDGCVLPLDNPQGWEAAVFDHYQALVSALCHKLMLGQRAAQLVDVIGGSTFGFEVWPDHPHFEEARGLLKATRNQCRDLRERIAAHNAGVQAPPSAQRITFYFGQNIQDEAGELDADSQDD